MDGVVPVVSSGVARKRVKKRMDRQAGRLERETTRAELVLPAGEVAAARAVARRLRQVVFSIETPEGGTRRLAFEPPDERWQLAYAVDPSGALILGPAAPMPISGAGEPNAESPPELGPSAAVIAASEAATRHRRRTLDRLRRRADTLEVVPRVDERSWAGIDRLVPEQDRRDVRSYALSGVSGAAVAERLRTIIARELAALDPSTGPSLDR